MKTMHTTHIEALLSGGAIVSAASAHNLYLYSLSYR